MNAVELSQALKNGTRVYGTLIVSPAPSWAPQLKRLGLDFVFIDTEHISLDRHQIAWMCQTYRALNLAPLVRITSPDPYQATTALDGGACGVIVPYVETTEQVQALRGAIKLRPLRGQKLQNILDGKEACDGELGEYIAEHNKENIFIVNIESVPALDALDDILQVPGLDAVLVGPHDLSCSLGIPEQYHHPEFERTVRTIFRKARIAGVGAGMHFWAGMDQQIPWAQEGDLNLIVHRADILNFVESMKEELRVIKEALGDNQTERSGSLNV